MPVTSTKKKLIELLSATEIPESPLPAESDIHFCGLEFDSREIKGSELFVALPGEKSHGNSFAQIALQNGAALVIAEKSTQLPALTAPERVLLVDNSLEAFWKIAGWWRKELNIPTMAITGSVGKTTCKEIAASILCKYSKGCYSLKSHNNHVGVPYTICRSSKEDQWMILEIGMNNRGEIGALSQLAAPDLAVITTIAPAHIGNLGDMQAVANEKLDIVRGLKFGADLIVGKSETLLLDTLRARSDCQQLKLNYFSADEFDDSDISNLQFDGMKGINFNLRIENSWHVVKMNILGRKNALNAACAAKACKLLIPQLSAEQIQSGLQNFEAPQMRLNLKTLADKTVVIDDSYNANPSSMSASIELLFDLAATNKELQIALVLGDMLELGVYSEDYHQQISQQIADLRTKKALNFVVAVGNFASFYLSKLPKDSDRYIFCENLEQACDYLSKQKFDLLLVKGSRGIGLDKVVGFLVEKRGSINSD